MERLSKLVRPHILDLKPYASARDDFSGQAEVFLDANENPFEKDQVHHLNRYPDPHQLRLKNKLAELKGVNTEQIFVGNGSDEPIELLIRSFCTPGRDRVILMPPTYGMYGVSARVNDVAITRVPLTPELQMNLPALSDLPGTHKILFVCNPNNPTGNLLNREDIREVAGRFPGLVVVDEAYIDFADEMSMIAELGEFPNLVVLQTFSKARGLAGIRLGMAYAHPYVISVLNTIKPPYNINAHTQALGYEALSDSQEYEQEVITIKEQRKRLTHELAQLEQVETVFPSQTNFILARFKDHSEINRYLQDNGVIVRDRSKEMYCDSCLRITVGTPEENTKLLNLLNQIA